MVAGVMRKAVRVVLYLVVLTVAVNVVSRLFFVRQEKPPHNPTTKITGFFAEPKDTLDVVFIGASTAYMGINPSILWREYGITSYDFCSSGQKAQLTQLYVKDAIVRQHPRVICVDMNGMRFDNDYNSEQYNYASLSLFPLSLNKLHTIFQYTPKEEWMGHLLPLVKYHSAGKINFKNLAPAEQDPYLGYSPSFISYGKSANYKSTARYEETGPLADNVEKAFKEIITVCRENNVRLLLYATPVSIAKSARQRVNEVKRIAAEENIPVLDFNDEAWLSANDYDARTDTSDNYHHANWRGASKITHTFGEYLINVMHVADHRADPAYASWQEKTEPYYRDAAPYEHQVLMDRYKKLLKEPEDLVSYLQLLCDMPKDGVVIIISAYDEAANKMTKPADELLINLGAKDKLKGKIRYGYLLVNIDGNTEYFNMDHDHVLTYETKVGDVPILACSAGFEAPKTVENNPDVKSNEVIIKKKKYHLHRGLTVFVYDYQEKVMISQANFDTQKTTDRSK